MDSITKNKFYIGNEGHNICSPREKAKEQEEYRLKQQQEQQMEELQSKINNISGNPIPCLNKIEATNKDRSVSKVDDCIICKCSQQYSVEKRPGAQVANKVSDVTRVASLVAVSIAGSILAFILLAIIMIIFNPHTSMPTDAKIASIVSLVNLAITALISAAAALGISGIFAVVSLISARININVEDNNHKLYYLINLNKLVLEHMKIAAENNEDLKKLLSTVRVDDQNITELLTGTNISDKMHDIAVSYTKIHNQICDFNEMNANKKEIKKRIEDCKGIEGIDLKEVEKKAKGAIDPKIKKIKREKQKAEKLCEKDIKELLNLLIDNTCARLVEDNKTADESKSAQKEIKSLFLTYISENPEEFKKDFIKNVGGCLVHKLDYLDSGILNTTLKKIDFSKLQL